MTTTGTNRLCRKVSKGNNKLKLKKERHCFTIKVLARCAENDTAVHVHVHKNKVMLGHDTKRTFRYFSDFAQKIKMPKQAANQCESFAFLQLSIDRLFAHIFQFFHFNLKFSFKKVKYWQKIKFENLQSNEK